MTVLSELLKSLAAGQIPAEVPSECEYQTEVQQLVEQLAHIARFSQALAAGDLSVTLQGRGVLVGSLKALHANLRHLTWQTQQVAAGDFKQRVDFLGEFSTAFNAMVQSLARARDELVRKNQQIALAYKRLKAAQAQLLQQEKMASIGQLAAGIAHEINNPIGFVMSNLDTFRAYSDALAEVVGAADELAGKCQEADRRAFDELRRKRDVSYILQDPPALIEESLTGAKRVRDIVHDLKAFSHLDEAGLQPTNINECLATTVNIAGNLLTAKADVIADYGEVPLILGEPHQLNQLFLSLLLNASQAIESRGQIRIKTWCDDGDVVVAISDTGCGIPSNIIGRIFEPFFTTRDVGQGAGLGLAISYDIVKKHGGTIKVASVVGAGTTFSVRLPSKAAG